MGLDMYAGRTRTKLDKEIDFGQPEDHEEVHRWRKHPDLHGWMQRLYVRKGGNPDPEYFNVVPVVLTEEDLSELETAVRERRLPETDGFFFGASDGSEVEDDLGFIARARESIEDGWTVYYISWW